MQHSRKPQHSMERRCSAVAYLATIFCTRNCICIPMLVFCCYNCGNLLVGKQCYQHHSKSCISFGPPTWHVYNSPAPRTGQNRNHRWINCDGCMRQQNLAGTFRIRGDRPPPVISAPLLWARLLLLLVRKKLSLAAWSQTCKEQQQLQLCPCTLGEISNFIDDDRFVRI
jgi:hypothetical protein